MQTADTSATTESVPMERIGPTPAMWFFFELREPFASIPLGAFLRIVRAHIGYRVRVRRRDGDKTDARDCAVTHEREAPRGTPI